MARSEVSRRTRREEVFLVDEADNPTLPKIPDNYFYYFAYGHCMWRDQMKHCISPDAKLVGVAYLPNWRWFMTSRHKANIIETTQEERDTLPKHKRRVYGLVWAVPYGNNKHLRRAYTNEDEIHRLDSTFSERLDCLENARLNSEGKRAKSSPYRSEACQVTFVTVPEIDGERRRYIDELGAYPQGEVTCRVYIDRSRLKNYIAILPYYKLIMNMGFADFLNLYHEKRYVDNLRVYVPAIFPDKMYPVMNRDYYKLLDQMSEMLDKDENLDMDDRRSSIFQQPDQNARDDAATVSSRGFVGGNDEEEDEDARTESAYTASKVSKSKSSRHSHHHGHHHGHHHHHHHHHDDDDDDDQSEQSRRTRRTRVTRRGREDDESEDDDSRYRRDDDDYDDDDRSVQSRRTRATRATRATGRGRDDDDYEDDRSEQSYRRDDGRGRGARSTVTKAQTVASSDASEYELVPTGRGNDRRSTKPRRMAILDEYSDLDDEESMLLIQQQEVRQTLDIRELPSRSRREKARQRDRDQASDMRSVYQDPDKGKQRKIVLTYR